MASTANLAVLNVPQGFDAEKFDSFSYQLACWCSKWIPEIGVPIMRKAKDLYDDPAVRILLNEWYAYKLKNEMDTRERLVRAAMDDELESESEGAKYEFANSPYRREQSIYSSALHTLLVK